MQWLTRRNEWQFFAVLPRADVALASLWWLILVLRGMLPALFAIAMGRLVSAVQRADDLALPLTVVGFAFVLGQVLNPIHHAISANLGDRTGRRVVMFSPAGMERFFLETGAQAPDQETDARAAFESAIRHGWEFVRS